MRTHRFDPISFVFGLGFVGLALLFALPAEPWEIYFGGLSLGWVWPVVAIAAGLALLAPVLRSGRADPDRSEDGTDGVGI
jgi:hypothetical protein